MSNDLTEKESEERVEEKQEIYDSTPRAVPPLESSPSRGNSRTDLSLYNQYALYRSINDQ